MALYVHAGERYFPIKFGLSEKSREQVARANEAASHYFSIESVGEYCTLYPDVPATRIIKIMWRVDETEVSFGVFHALLLLVGHVSFGLKSKVVKFETFHPFSSCGLWRLRLLHFMADLIKVIAILAMLLGVIMLFIAGLMWLISLGDHPTHADDLKSAVHGLVVALVLEGGGFFATRFAPQIGLPGVLKEIGKWPIRLYTFQKVRKPVTGR